MEKMKVQEVQRQAGNAIDVARVRAGIAERGERTSTRTNMVLYRRYYSERCRRVVYARNR